MDNGGKSFENGGSSSLEMKKRSKVPLILGILGIVIVAGIITLAVVITRGKSGDSYLDKMDLGRRYLEELNYEQAIIAFEDAIKIDPKNKDAYLELIEVYRLTGEDSKALKIIKKAEKNLDDEDDLYLISEKRKEIEGDENGEPYDSEYEKLIIEGRKYFEKGQNRKAIETYEEAIDVNPALYKAYVGLYDVYVSQEEYKSARIVVEGGMKEVTGEYGQKQLEACIEELDRIAAGENPEREAELPENPSVTETPEITDTPEETDDPSVTDDPEITPEEIEKINVRMSIRQIDNSNYPEIAAYTDITDMDGNDIDNIGKSDIEAREIDASGGVHVITIEEIKKVIGSENIAINLVIDKSASMSTSDLNQVKNAVRSLINCMDFAGGDRMEIISFDSYVYMTQPFTSNADDLRAALDRISSNGNTAIFDAIYAGIYQTYYEKGSRCVIAFTDGEENSSSYSYDDVVNLSKTTGIPVYIVGVGSEYDANRYNNLATSCGGEYYSSSYNDLETVLSDIYIGLYREQQNYYVIRYETSNTENTSEEWNLCMNMRESSAYSGECEKAYYAEADMSGAFSDKYYFVDYILSFSSDREITDDDLEGLSLAELRIARNEIFARHGRQFKDKLLNQWFYSKQWYLDISRKYSPTDFEKLNPYPITSLENKNVDKILAYEQKLMDSQDIYPNAAYVELSGYDLALSKSVLTKALKQMENYPKTAMLEENIRRVKEAIEGAA